MTGKKKWHSSMCANLALSSILYDVQILERQIGCTSGVPCQVSTYPTVQLTYIPYTRTHVHDTCTHSTT